MMKPFVFVLLCFVTAIAVADDQEVEVNQSITIQILQLENQNLQNNIALLTEQLYAENGACCKEEYQFYVSEKKGNFDECQQECLSNGGNMLSWDTFGFGSVGSEYFCTIRMLTQQHEYGVWIGLTDRATEGDWRWLDGTKFSPQSDVEQLVKWKSGSPDNNKDKESTGQDCARYRWKNDQREFLLLDRECSNKDQKCLCQRKVMNC